MLQLNVKNVQEALQKGVTAMEQFGVRRSSRNGPVLVVPGVVTTTYQQPVQRVLFSAARDASPFFHLYEALWMLQGRRDIQPLVRYAKNMAHFSDDGVTQHGAYGDRWRVRFGVDQLDRIIRRLREDPGDRRCVLQMWDTRHDLDRSGRDVPCNVACTLQVSHTGELDLVVFCRSNDIFWGAYGANAVHMSILQEYVAGHLRRDVGTYTQVSVNWHAYVELWDKIAMGIMEETKSSVDPYAATTDPVLATPFGFLFPDLDEEIERLMVDADNDFRRPGSDIISPNSNDFIEVARRLLLAHSMLKSLARPEAFRCALQVLSDNNRQDWIVAAREWVLRRQARWQTKMDGQK